MPDFKKISPTAFAKASLCLHSWYLECYGDKSRKKEFDAGLKLLMARGEEYERKVVAGLEGLAEPQWDGRDLAQGFAATRELMQKGVDWIYQGVLVSDIMQGYPDLLKKVVGASAFGNYTYMPVDIKSHKSVSKKDRFQLFAYALLLERLLGVRMSRAAIWLNTGEQEEVDLGRNDRQYTDILSRMTAVAEARHETMGFRCAECSTCPWEDFCAKGWQVEKSICLVYGVTGETARKIWQAGIETYDELAAYAPDELAAAAGLTDKASVRISFMARAWRENRVIRIKPASFPQGIPVHFWDIETFGKVTYLHGNIRIANGKREEKFFFADSPAGEREVWQQYLDYLARDREAVVYNWADYERGFAHSLWDAYGGNPDGFKHLQESMIDQCAFVREHFALPISSYSIKKVAPFFGFKWQAEDAGGLNSESWYKDWLESGDRAIRDKILQYNLDDVIAMEVIDRELRKI